MKKSTSTLIIFVACTVLSLAAGVIYGGLHALPSISNWQHIQGFDLKHRRLIMDEATELAVPASNEPYWEMGPDGNLIKYPADSWKSETYK